MSVKSNVLYYAKKRGISVASLEKQAGIGNGLISKWKEDTMPTNEVLGKLSDFLGVSRRTLIFGRPRVGEEDEQSN